MDVESISPEQLDLLFGETPDITTDTTTSPEVVDKVTIPAQDGFSGITEMNLDELEEDDKNKSDSTESDTTDTEESATSSSDTKPEVSTVLKNTVEYLVKQGIWEDFDGREDLEIDEKTYAELASKQVDHKVNSMFDELVDSTGDYGKAIINHIKEGGNPDVIIDLFKEQKQIEAIDTSSDEGKIEKIGTYYSEVLGWKPERIKKHLQRIIADQDIDSEFSDIDEQFTQYYESRLDEINNVREAQRQQILESQKQFITNLQTSLDDLGYKEKDKKFIESSLLEIVRNKEGVKTTRFKEKYSEIQKDPKKLIKLVEFVMDENKFINRIKTKEETEAATKTFNFIKGNSATSKSKSSATVEQQSQNTKLDFSLLLK